MEILHFFGEVEAVFGIWAIPLLLAAAAMKGWPSVESYVANVHFTEPMFVVVVMAIASTRPVLSFAERSMGGVASLGGRTPLAWWAAILTVGPLLGSFITEPAAMTICALLLARHLYELDPSPRLKYGTLGLLFVNVSVGGTLTHFAAPPVLMVAAKYGWGLTFMLRSFGWKAALAVVVSTALFGFVFRKEFSPRFASLVALQLFLECVLLLLLCDFDRFGRPLDSRLKIAGFCIGGSQRAENVGELILGRFACFGGQVNCPFAIAKFFVGRRGQYPGKIIKNAVIV